MKRKVWAVETRELERVNNGLSLNNRKRYVEGKTKKGAIANAINIWCLRPNEIRNVYVVDELS